MMRLSAGAVLVLLATSVQGSCIPEFGAKAQVVTIAGSGGTGGGLAVPTDLQFHPLKDGELWVASSDRQDSRLSGNWIIEAAGTDQQSEGRLLRDRIAYHYQDKVAAIAFDSTGEKFFSCQESTNTYSGLAPDNFFQGPTAYEVMPCGAGYGRKTDGGGCRDLTIDSKGKEGGGSDYIIHSDMLHEGPLCTGIAHDKGATTGTSGLNGIPERTPGNVVWHADGSRGKLMRSDFDKLHTTEMIDHRFANVRRYVDVDLFRKPGVPSHMVVDDAARILYISDAGNKRVLRVDADSGKFLRDATCIDDMCFAQHNKRYTCYPATGDTVTHDSEAACAAACEGGECFWNYYEMGCEAGHCQNNECAMSDGLGCYNLFTESGDYFEYELWGCTKWDVLTSDVGTPSGIALGPDGRIFVADWDSGNIHALDRSGNKQAVFTTGAPGVSGLEVECSRNRDGCRLWFTNALRKEVSYVEVQNACPAGEVAAAGDVRGSWAANTNPVHTATCAAAPDKTRPNFLARHGPNYNDRMVVNHTYGKNCSNGLAPGEWKEGWTTEKAAPCPDRLDCANMNLDLLVMAGFYCHPCIISPCMNGGKCTNIAWKGFTCDCAPGSSGPLCETRPSMGGGALPVGATVGIAVGTLVFGVLIGAALAMLVGGRRKGGGSSSSSSSSSGPSTTVVAGLAAVTSVPNGNPMGGKAASEV